MQLPGGLWGLGSRVLGLGLGFQGLDVEFRVLDFWV